MLNERITQNPSKEKHSSQFFFFAENWANDSSPPSPSNHGNKVRNKTMTVVLVEQS